MKKLTLLLFLLLTSTAALAADSLLIASGAGYKTVMEPLAQAYADRTGNVVERIYGNMGQIIGQAGTSGKVDLLVGEEGFLRASKLALAESTPLGRGRLVLAWPKGKPEPKDLRDASIGRIAQPDPGRAIYGKAAHEYLENTGLLAALGDRLVIVGTVPQVFTYVVTGEVDAGFMNLTQALAGKDRLGGYTEVDSGKYRDIAISCIRLAGSPNPDAARSFAEFLKTDAARAIIGAHGL